MGKINDDRLLLILVACVGIVAIFALIYPNYNLNKKDVDTGGNNILGESINSGMKVLKPTNSLNLQLYSIDNKIPFNVDGSPDDPYAMEFSQIVLVVKNMGNKKITRNELNSNIPAFDIDNFHVMKKPSYVYEGGYWNPSLKEGLKPKESAIIKVDGYFKLEGKKKIKAQLENDVIKNFVQVLPNPVCYDSDGNENYLQGWAIGATSCLDPKSCVSLTRSEDLCNGDKLNEYICQKDSNNISKKYVNFVECPKGCKDGACIDFCEDSDGGKDIYTKGHVNGSKISWSGDDRREMDDSCIDHALNSVVESCEASDQCTVFENFCMDNTMYYEYTPCPNGCKDGACVKELCNDTDGGINYEKVGTTTGIASWTNELITENDGCVDRRPDVNSMVSSCDPASTCQLYEYYCQNDKVEYKDTYSCPNGCQDGACITESDQKLPDLVIKEFSWTPLYPKVNESIKFNVTIKNVGTSTWNMILTFDVALYIPDIINPINPEFGEFRGYNWFDKALDVNEERQKILSFSKPLSFSQPGEHIVYVILDESDCLQEVECHATVKELNEYNNELKTIITVTT